MKLVWGAVLLIASFAALAGAEPKSTAECSQFVPEGKQYSYKVEGTVDRTARGAAVKETVTVSGTRTFAAPVAYKQTEEENARSAAEFGKESGPFKSCLEAVLGGK